MARWLIVFVCWVPVLAGCEKPVHFPAESLAQPARQCGAVAAYDTAGKGKADFFFFADAAGRITRLGYDTTGTGKPDTFSDLDKIPFAQCRHLVIILDGFGYEVVNKFYDEGNLRYFHPPAKVIAPYPDLTDECIEDALGGVPCIGMEALYYDRKQNREVGGTTAYLECKNEPYAAILQYRASMIVDGIGYLYPWSIFQHELNATKREFDRSPAREFLAYYVSSAGMGTRFGAEGQRKCLVELQRLLSQVLQETHGRVKITLLADHGHSYTPSTRIPLEKFLEGRKWRLTDSLQKPRDVVYTRFGLETYAAFATREAETLAQDLAAADGVELASFAQKDAVVVLGKNGQRACIRRKGDRYRYETIGGDPLKLKPLLASLKPDADGFYDWRELLARTVDHEYPDPLERLWRAHFGLVENPPDVIISLEDKFYSGSTGFAGFIDVASTHGGLNRANSTTFLMTTIGTLPPFLRSADIPAVMKNITGDKFPMRK